MPLKITKIASTEYLLWVKNTEHSIFISAFHIELNQKY